MKKNITIGILAHVDAGKTTLSEGLLFLSGAIRNMGRVDHRDTFLDTYELERSRGITIFSKQAIFEYDDITFTLLDTPGHSDFSPEMERTLQILDMAVLLISAPDGVTGQVRILKRLLEHYNVPTVIFVNKMDQLESSARAVVNGDKESFCAASQKEDPAGKYDESIRKDILDLLRKELKSNIVDFTDGTGDAAVLEELAVCDDALLSSFLDGAKLTGADIKMLIAERKAFPCLFGCALKMEGVKELLDLLAGYAGDFKKAADRAEESSENSDEKFGARVFKISRDASGSRLTHMKIVSGTLRIRDQIGDEKIDQIRLYSGEKYKNVSEATKGMVCAVTGLSGTRAGEGLGRLESEDVYEVLQPILSSALILPDEADPVVLYRNLKLLEEEEPMLQVSFLEKSREIQLQLMGEVQKEILSHLIKERFGLDVKFGPAHIVYKETIAGPSEGVGHFEPLRHYAEVHVMLEPLEPGSGVQFGNECSTDELALNWQRLIMTHLAEKKHLGVLTGSEITDIRITLLTGKSHVKHTEGGDFRQATYRAVRQGLMMADSILLEPVYDVRIELPIGFVGRALTDLERMNGSISSPEMEGEKAVITGRVPAACLLDYASEVTSYTKGEGKLFSTLSGYAPCHNAEEVIGRFGYDPSSDLGNSPDSVFCSHGAGVVIPWDKVREYMHVDSGWTPDGFQKKTDLTDSIDMEALRKLQIRNQNKDSDERSFAEIEKDLRATDNELKEIFERTYGKVRPRYEEAKAVCEILTPEEKQARRNLEVEEDKRRKYENAKPDPRIVSKEYLLVDGYNIIYASKELSSLASADLKAARDRLIDILSNFAGFRREEVLLVFDAYRVPGGREHVEEIGGILVIYTKEAETADQYIEKAAHEMSKKYRVTVATSDAIEQVIVLSSGAYRLSARDLFAEIERTNEDIRAKLSDRHF
ncbi:MAG: NYN domain-containing protein [Butyrivibrio sp.]|nr:NYN domain-containing protein [Butyrivibrio sp.]